MSVVSHSLAPNNDLRFLPLRRPEYVVEADVHHVKAIQQRYFGSSAQRAFDQGRVLGVVSAGPDAEGLLIQTLPNLIDQAHASKKAITVLVGLNNGTRLSPSFYSKINRLLDVEIRKLWTEPKQNVFHRARSYSSFSEDGDYSRKEETNLAVHNHCQGRSRIIFVNQPADQNGYAAGKIRMLADLSKLILDSIEKGWSVPEHTLLFDSETYLFESESRGNRIPDITSNGLSKMFYELVSDKDQPEIVGSRWYCTPFSKGFHGDLPCFEMPVHPVVSAFNTLFGNAFKWLSGGGTLGYSENIIPLIYVISKYPGARMEDLLLTVLADSCGTKWKISDNVHNINRSYPVGDGFDVTQPKRWMSGIAGVRNLYGEAVSQCCDLDALLRHPLGDSIRSYICDGLSSPDQIIGTDANGAWRSTSSLQVR